MVAWQGIYSMYTDWEEIIIVIIYGFHESTQLLL